MKNSTVWVVVLSALILVCLAMVPWNELSRESKSAVKEALKVRFDEYSKLRLENDWSALYDMTVPRHREQVSRTKFLQFLGHGMLVARHIKLNDVGYDKRLNIGATKFDLTIELVLEAMPPAQRPRVENPDDLRKSSEMELHWQRVGGQWYFEMDEAVLSGQANGQDIRPTVDWSKQQSAGTTAPTTGSKPK